MKLLFWNIGPTPNAMQLAFVNTAISNICPDILCLSEGTPSIVSCTDLVASIEGLGYSTFYHPNLNTQPVINNQYDYNKLGLKLFYTNTTKVRKNFSFADQQAEGRILHCRFKFANDFYSCFFIHNMSATNDQIVQSQFLFKLRLIIDAKRRLHQTDKFFIFGDFNLQPWDPLLRRKDIIKSYFFEKEHTFYNSANKKDLYYNPFFDYIQSHLNNLLLGTFHNAKYSSLIDFALFSEGMKNFDIEICDTITGINMLTNRGNKIFIHNEFDHLPVLITLK
jgi:hypothetical protein